jgi:hypothetical protein
MIMNSDLVWVFVFGAIALGTSLPWLCLILSLVMK